MPTTPGAPWLSTGGDARMPPRPFARLGGEVRDAARADALRVEGRRAAEVVARGGRVVRLLIL